METKNGLLELQLKIHLLKVTLCIFRGTLFPACYSSSNCLLSQ